MAGEEHRDPAEIAAERREAVDRHIAGAQKMEEAALEAECKDNLVAATRLMTCANNSRLQALCIHARIDEFIDGEGT